MTKQSEIEMVAKARAWAIKAHTGQKDKAGKDYFRAHVAVVAEGVKGDPVAETVAFLHDTVEDTSITIEDIRTGFPKEVAAQWWLMQESPCFSRGENVNLHQKTQKSKR